MDKPSTLIHHSHGADLESTLAEADKGSAEAQFTLGFHYASTQGAGQDYPQAATWFLKAAKQNHFMAQFNLGVMYTAGQGVAKDSAQAVIWFNKAADQGDPGAQFRLGVFHQGASLEALPAAASESRVEAYKWYQSAAVQGYLGAQSACDALALMMTVEDVANGKVRAAVLAPIKANYSAWEKSGE